MPTRRIAYTEFDRGQDFFFGNVNLQGIDKYQQFRGLCSPKKF